MNKLKHIVIDNLLYEISIKDYDSLMGSVGSCCGCCSPESLQELREESLRIKAKYPGLYVFFHSTPNQQFISQNPNDTYLFEFEDLPF